MNCDRCGTPLKAGMTACPRCGHRVNYGGNTAFVAKTLGSSLTLKDFFDGSFKRHPKGTGAKLFIAGTPLSTPSPDRMLREWVKPWLYLRVLGVGLIFALLCFVVMGYTQWLGTILLYSFCSLIFPLCVLTFFWEINIPRDIPLYHVLIIFLIGGILSIIFALAFGISGRPAYLAPLTEEPAKILAAVIFICWLKPKYIFGGLLIGAAVGAGFAAFENISYVFAYDSTELLVMRSLDAFGTHAAWAAMESGALLLVMDGKPLSGKAFIDYRFLIYLAAAMGLHALWNSGIQLIPLPLIKDLIFVLLMAAAIYAVFTLVKAASAQVLRVAGAAQRRPPAPAQTLWTLAAVSGPLAGTAFPVRETITIGRDAGSCGLVFPKETPGVSRRHCCISPGRDGLYIMDLGSSQGTYLGDWRRLPPNQWVRVEGMFYLGSQAVSFAVKR